MQRSQSFAEAITHWTARRLSRWGVDAQQYHFLLQASLKMDFRTPSSVLRTDQSSHTGSALKLTIGMNLIFRW
jgi:hypothetical protein